MSVLHNFGDIVENGQERMWEAGDQSEDYGNDPSSKCQGSEGICHCSLCKRHPWELGNIESPTPKKSFILL